MYSSDSVLYFPSIEFKSARWLKSSLLVWDVVYRMVPAEYQPEDPPEVREAIDAGAVRDIKLSSQDRTAAMTEFDGFLKSLGGLPAGFIPTISDDPADFARVHVDKIDQRLYPALQELAAQFEGEWIRLPAEIARGYMLYLARAVGRERALPMATDNPDAWVVASFVNLDGEFSDYVHDAEAPGQYCCVGFRHILPATVDQVPMKDILRVGRESAADKQAFRETATTFFQELSFCNDVGHAEQVVGAFRDRLTERMDALRARSRPWAVQGLWAQLSVGLPTGMTSAGAIALLHPAAAEVALPSIAVGTVAALASHRQGLNQSKADPVASYLLEIDKAAGTFNLFDGFQSRMHEFIND